MTEDSFSRDRDGAPADGPSSMEDTLGGYLTQHHRPPAFEGSDGHPYTVSPEVERTPNLPAPYAGFLVFPRWALTGAGIIGHLETPTLLEGTGKEEVEEELGALSLQEVKDLLEGAITRQKTEETD